MLRPIQIDFDKEIVESESTSGRKFEFDSDSSKESVVVVGADGDTKVVGDKKDHHEVTAAAGVENVEEEDTVLDKEEEEATIEEKEEREVTPMGSEEVKVIEEEAEPIELHPIDSCLAVSRDFTNVRGELEHPLLLEIAA